jgi:small subunit ribosomal protein S27e
MSSSQSKYPLTDEAFNILVLEVKADNMIPMPNSKFIKVRCKKCRNEQIIFDKAATTVKCLVCSAVLAEPTGGMARLSEKNVESVEVVES